MGYPIESTELWPSRWPETRTRALEQIGQFQDKLLCSSLLPKELLEVVSIVHHVRFGWQRSRRNPVVEAGVRTIRGYFVQTLSIDPGLSPRRQYQEILKRTLPSGYFSETDASNPELLAMAVLVHTAHARRRNTLQVDFSGLVAQPK